MKIALYGRPFSKGFEGNIATLFSKLAENKIDVIIYRPFYNFLVHQTTFKPFANGFFEKHEDILDNADYMFSIGGDGTFLESVNIIRSCGIPIIGINTGRLGFLANISPDQIESSLSAILSGNYSIEQRTLAQLSLSEGSLPDFCCALNEISIHKKSSSMITIHTYLNDSYMNSYWADGLIISTPTGSTAYSMSVGGPIVTPDCSNFIISPIASHNLTIRPVIVPDHNIIRLKVDSREDSFLLSVDARTEIVNTNVEMIIKRTDFTIKTIRIENNTFYSTLRSKLMWGVDKRN